ncbi:MAG TPA: SRPBCC family protein, partial [Acidobacteriota bacterium]|nr:SRPBCC family protein [Acidobacteriota bacterium]
TSWFAEQAEVDLDEGRYAFWGRFTPNAPSGPRQELVSFQPGRRLEYDWQLDAGLSRVRIELEDAGQGSLMRVHQNSPEVREGDPSIFDFWSLSAENLRRLLESGGPPVLCDFAVRPRGQVSYSVDIGADRSTVYQALIDPRQLNRYIASDAEVEPRKGGVYNFGWKGGGPIKILDLEPERKLAYSWNYHDGDTVVQWELEDSGGGTRLTIVHSGFAEDQDLEGYRCGWLNFLNLIKSMSEQGASWKAPRTIATDCPEGA